MRELQERYKPVGEVLEDIETLRTLTNDAIDELIEKVAVEAGDGCEVAVREFQNQCRQVRRRANHQLDSYAAELLGNVKSMSQL